MFGFLKKKTDSGHNLLSHSQGAGSSAKTVDVSGFNKVVNFCLYALVLVTPVMFLPWTSEVSEFNKQAFLFAMVALMLGVWVIKLLTTRKVTWVKTSLDFILLAYLGVYFLTSLLSLDQVSSFLGYYGRFTGSFISVLCVVLLYFLVANSIKSERVVKRLTDFYVAGSALVLGYSFLQLLGLHILPGFTRDRGFNPIGSLGALAVYAAINIVFIQWLWMFESPSKSKKIFLGCLTAVALAIVFMVNGFAAWLVLALSLVAFLAICLAVSSQESGPNNLFWRPMILLVVAVIFLGLQFMPANLNPRNLVKVQVPVEIQLSNSANWTLVTNSFKQGAKNILLGSGPGTTGIAFGSIKPQELNKTIVWSLNFDRASNEVANVAIESGIVGLLVFEFASLLFLLYAVFFLLKRTEHAGWKYAFGFFLLWFGLYLTHFFYFFNTTFYFLYWLSIGVFMAVSHMNKEMQENHELSLSSSPRSALSWMFGSLLVLAALLVGVFFQAIVYGGELAYTQGLRTLSKQNPDLAAATADLGQAATLNPYRDVYFLAYGQSLIAQAASESQKEKPDQALIQNLVAELIAAGQKAVTISPNRSANWATLAQFYANIKPLTSNADQFVINALKQAVERDPNNPALHYQLGQAYLGASSVPDTEITNGTDTDKDGLSDAVESRLGSDPNKSDTNGNSISDGAETQSGLNPRDGSRLTAEQINSFNKIDQAAIKSAEDELKKAIELKNDLPEFYVQLSRIQQRAQKAEEAKKTMETGVSLFPNSPDMVFELGVIMFNLKDYPSAQTLFQRVIALSPDYANAHYSLGLTYQQQGDKARALSEYQKVRELIVAAKGDTTQIDEAIKSVQ